MTVLRDVSYEWYVQLMSRPANRFLRMAHFDGTWEIMSPIDREHEISSARIRLFVTTVAGVLGLTPDFTGGIAWYKQGDGPRNRTRREADQSFFIQAAGRLPLVLNPDLDGGDPPPDL